MYAVKLTAMINGYSFILFAGRRGEKKSRLEKIEGWKNESTAVKYIQEQKKLDKESGSKALKVYEIVKF